MQAKESLRNDAGDNKAKARDEEVHEQQRCALGPTGAEVCWAGEVSG